MDRFRDHANWAVLGLFWLIVTCLALAIIVYGWHLLTPWPFLAPVALEKIQTILFSAIASSLLTGYAKKRLT